MKTIHYSDRARLERALKRLDARVDYGSDEIGARVGKIIDDVRKRGAVALSRYSKKFDRVGYDPRSSRVGASEIEAAYRRVKPSTRSALELMARRIERFHKRQAERGWSYKDGAARLELRVQPLDSVGIYAPGGKAIYPSSALMSAIPARLAGVGRIALVSPPDENGRLDDLILAAGKIGRVDEIYKIGGAQAIAALAFGVDGIARVDKIVGPGNAYVAEAKRRLYGIVDIDMVAGPSEILLIADETGSPEAIAADLLAQAEHDELAIPILLTDSSALAESVKAALKRRLGSMARAFIARESLRRSGAIFILPSIDAAVDIANRIAPEHLSILTRSAHSYVDRLKNFGALFIGEFTPEAIGDYTAGSNHILPTGGAARFSSPLGLYDFVKRSSIIEFDRASLKRLAAPTIEIATAENLPAHAEAIQARDRAPLRRAKKKGGVK